MRRQVAHRLNIASLQAGKAVFEAGRFAFLSIGERKVARINLIANVVDRYESVEKPYISLTVDDGSGQIRLKAFADNTKLLSKANIGDCLLVIGWLRHFNGELYVLPEIVRKVARTWLAVRKKELGSGEPVEDLKRKVKDLASTEKGISLTSLVTAFGDGVKTVVEEMTKAGEIYEASPGLFKAV